MDEKYNLPVYINTSIVQDLSSVLLDGYYDSKICRTSYDNYILGRLQDLCRRQNTDDIKTSPFSATGTRPPSLNNPASPRGPKLDPVLSKDVTNTNLTLTLDEAILNYDEFLKFFDTRSSTFSEVTATKRFTLAYFLQLIKDVLRSKCLLKNIDSNCLDINTVCPGDYIILHSCLSVNSLYTYTSTLISILNGYGTAFLDSSFDNSAIGPLTYTMIVNLLNTISSALSKNNTTEFLASSKCLNSNLTLVNSYYTNSGYIYDLNNSQCSIFAKVTKVITYLDEALNLFEKTGLSAYYTSLLNSFKPYLDILNQNGYAVPVEYTQYLSSPALELIPISISV